MDNTVVSVTWCIRELGGITVLEKCIIYHQLEVNGIREGEWECKFCEWLYTFPRHTHTILYICVCAYIHRNIHIINTNTDAHWQIYVCVHVCMCVCVRAYVCIYVCVCLYTYTHIDTCVYVWVCVCLCAYTYILCIFMCVRMCVWWTDYSKNSQNYWSINGIFLYAFLYIYQTGIWSSLQLFKHTCSHTHTCRRL